MMIFSERFIKVNKIRNYKNRYITVSVISTMLLYHSFCQFAKYNLKNFFLTVRLWRDSKNVGQVAEPPFLCLYIVKRGLEKSLEYFPEPQGL